MIVCPGGGGTGNFIVDLPLKVLDKVPKLSDFVGKLVFTSNRSYEEGQATATSHCPLDIKMGVVYKGSVSGSALYIEILVECTKGSRSRWTGQLCNVSSQKH